VGTHRDPERYAITLADGMSLCFSDGELQTMGWVAWSSEESLWMAGIN
jgi:hypothetical protein